MKIKMGIPTNIKTLLNGDVVEWARIEFKETWDPEASLKTICAFANDIDTVSYTHLDVYKRQDQQRHIPSEIAHGCRIL